VKIIAISGKMHSGKSYVTETLVEKGLGKRMSFAQALKDDIRTMGFPESAIKEKPSWMRRLMQVYGQAWRAVDNDYWCDRLIHQILTHHRQYKLPMLFPGEHDVFIIDDVRFENEADALLNLRDKGIDVMLIRLERKGYDRGDIVGSDDLSELALDDYPEFDCTYTVPSGDLQGLKDIARGLEEWING
jgi:hypothetical protein